MATEYPGMWICQIHFQIHINSTLHCLLFVLAFSGVEYGVLIDYIMKDEVLHAGNLGSSSVMETM